MKHICAWCGCETAQPDGTADDDLTTHGICEECKLVFLAEIKEYQTQKVQGTKT